MAGKMSILLFLFVLSARGAFAQESPAPQHAGGDTLVQRKNDIGFFLLGHSGDPEQCDQSLMGLQYKYWLRQGAGIRLMAGYNAYRHWLDPWPQQAISPDTLLYRQDKRKANMFFVGAGLEVHRQFYRKVYLTAAIDVIAGWGKGHSQTFTRLKAMGDTISSYGTEPLPAQPSEKYSRLHIRLLPAIGAKFVFSRVNFGVEASGTNVSFYREHTGNRPAESLIDFSLWDNVAYRLFLHYSF